MQNNFFYCHLKPFDLFFIYLINALSKTILHCEGCIGMVFGFIVPN